MNEDQAARAGIDPCMLDEIEACCCTCRFMARAETIIGEPSGFACTMPVEIYHEPVVQLSVNNHGMCEMWTAKP